MSKRKTLYFLQGFLKCICFSCNGTTKSTKRLLTSLDSWTERERLDTHGIIQDWWCYGQYEPKLETAALISPGFSQLLFSPAVLMSQGKVQILKEQLEVIYLSDDHRASLGFEMDDQWSVRLSLGKSHSVSRLIILLDRSTHTESLALPKA